MNRRRFLRGVAATGPAVTAGCGRLGVRRPVVDGDRIAAWRFETDRPADGRDPRTPPAVTFDEGAGRVDVRGYVYYGSGSCNEAKLDRLSDDPDADRLRVVVGHGDDGGLPEFGCTADVAGTFYRVRVRYDGALPGTVTVREDNSGFEDERRTVDR